MLDCFQGVNWQEVARLMSNGRSDKQCRLKWFEAIDPSVNRQREWDAEEDARLRKGERWWLWLCWWWWSCVTECGAPD